MTNHITMTPLKIIFLITTLSLTACDSYEPINLLKNSGFELETRNPKKAQHWGSWQHAGKNAYEMERDSTVAFTGNSSFRITQYAKEAYAMVGQLIQLPERKNKEFLFKAYLKTKDVATGDGWRLVVNCRSHDNIVKQYLSEGIKGTSEWQKVTLRGEIPEDTVKITLGAMLQSSSGTGWIDDTIFIIDPPKAQ